MKSFNHYITEAKKWTLSMLQVGDIVTYPNGVEAEVMDISDHSTPGYMSVHTKITKAGAHIRNKGYEL